MEKTIAKKTKTQKITEAAKAAKVMLAADAVEAARRLAVDEILTMAHGVVADLLTSTIPDHQQNSAARVAVVQALSSPQGAAFMALFVGGLMTAAEDSIPEEYQEIFADVAREFRVNAQYRGGKLLIEHLKPVFGGLVAGATQQLRSVVEAKEKLKTAEAIEVRDPSREPSSQG